MVGISSAVYQRSGISSDTVRAVMWHKRGFLLTHRALLSISRRGCLILTRPDLFRCQPLQVLQHLLEPADLTLRILQILLHLLLGLLADLLKAFCAYDFLALLHLALCFC